MKEKPNFNSELLGLAIAAAAILIPFISNLLK